MQAFIRDIATGKELVWINNVIPRKGDNIKYSDILYEVIGNAIFDFDNNVIYIDVRIKASTDIKFVDLDLPSGTKWANKNIGAKSEINSGLYFQWGDTVGYTLGQVGDSSRKKGFCWDDYKFGVDIRNLTKYNTTDKLTILESSDDAAAINMGSKWKMPTKEQFEELLTETDNEWTSISGINGRKFTSKTDSNKYIFLPAAGCLLESAEIYVDEIGGYWSSSLSKDDCYVAWNLDFSASYVRVKDNGIRCDGVPIRAVLAQ